MGEVGFWCSGCMDWGACIDTHVAKIYIDAALRCIPLYLGLGIPFSHPVIHVVSMTLP